ncbi:MAG: hypothetical protein SV062_05295, partial [Thermodesulfobacteriota bacterium]|nr:hypothetical protein [Thermodesulfobacteriota bacterium]
IRMVVARNTDSEERMAKGEGPYDIEDIFSLKGDIVDSQPMPPPMPSKKGDIIYIYGTGGAGYGDPLEREPDVVLKDVVNQLTTGEYAKEIYGVILEPQISGILTDPKIRRRIKVNEEGTIQKRGEIIRKRKARCKK